MTNFYEHSKLHTGDTLPQDPSIRASKEKEYYLEWKVVEGICRVFSRRAVKVGQIPTHISLKIMTTPQAMSTKYGLEEKYATKLQT